MSYNTLQEQAINSNLDKIVVVAPPGAGKTYTLVGAIKRFSQENPGSRITAITFTRKAASELNLKLMGVENVEASTIHSWSLRELNKLGAKYKFEVKLLQDREIEEILQLLCRNLGYFSINYFLLSSFIKGNYNLDISDGTKARFQKIAGAYEQYKRNNGLYDFTDLPLYLYDMLNTYNEEINNIDGLFVDEFQDVDGTQAIIFTKVNAKKHFYIGDPDQSIYMFRGASSEVINQLTDELGFTKLMLNENYRSYQSIVDYSTLVRENGGNMLDIMELQPSWIQCVRKEEPGEVYVIGEDAFVVDLVKHKGNDNICRFMYDLMQRKPYILCRSNKQVKAIQKLYPNVSTVHQAKGLQYQHVIFTAMDCDGEEETNIAYVACTRAEDSLTIIDFKVLEEILQDMKEEGLMSNEAEKLF